MGRPFGACASWMQGDARERRRPSGPASIAGGDRASRGARIRTVGPPRGALRLVALWVVLFAVYVVGDLRPTPEEQELLRIAATLVDDGEVVRSRLGIGFPLVIAPFGDRDVVELVLAAVAALGFVLAALLGRRIVPEPYASAGAGLAGLSAPAVAYAGAVLPPATAGTLLAGASLCAVAARETPRPAPVFGAAAMLALLPWLDPLLAIPALPVGVALYLWCREGRRATMGLIAVELVGASLVLYATLNERLYGGFTPWSALPSGVSPTGAQTLVEHLERLPRLLTLWLDPGAGLLRWAPIFAFVPFAAWLLRRSREEGLARVVPERASAEAAAGLALVVFAAVLLVAAFLVPTIDTEPFAARYLIPAFPVAGALIAWGLRHAPRVGAALGAITLAISAWQLI
jgi:hypothetical protein